MRLLHFLYPCMLQKLISAIKSDGTVVTEPKPSGPIQVGTASIDLLPLFLGNREICELIPVKKSQFFSLEDCRSIRNTPYLQIRILCDECLVEIENSNIVNLTVESLYNLPSIMAENMFYQIAVHIPNSEDVRFFIHMVILKDIFVNTIFRTRSRCCSKNLNTAPKNISLAKNVGLRIWISISLPLNTSECNNDWLYMVRK